MSQLHNLCNKKLLKLFFYTLSHCNIALVKYLRKIAKKYALEKISFGGLKT